MKATAPYLALLALAALAVFGGLPRLPQPLAYHEFADPYSCLGLPYCLDFLSNLPIGLVGLAGLWLSRESHPSPARSAYRRFFLALIVAGLASAYYHAAPDNLRLAWDRVGVVFALSAWLALVLGERHSPRLFHSWLLFSLAGLASVLYWIAGEQSDVGDLRPYLLFQATTFLWALAALSPSSIMPSRRFHLAAAALYAVALAGDLADRSLTAMLHIVSGHSLKHFFAAAAGAAVVLAWRKLLSR